MYHETETPALHPFRSQIWNGTCDAGQLTHGGLQDSIQHGKVWIIYLPRRTIDLYGILQDFWDVYHKKLGFLNVVDDKHLYVRTSTETRTFQVAGGMLYGMDPNVRNNAFKVHNQPGNASDALREIGLR